MLRWLFYKLHSLLLNKENSLYCPCCAISLKRWSRARFDEHPEECDSRRLAGINQNLVCPACGSLPRHRIMTWYLDNNKDILRGKEILYFAIEPCIARWLKRNKLSFTTADLYAPADLKINIEDIALADMSYSAVVCNHVLEHVMDLRQALSELHRILKPGGILICSFPMDPKLDKMYEDFSVTSPQERIKHFGQFDHVRIFGADSQEILESAGFAVTAVRGSEMPAKINPSVDPADYDSDIMFICRKA